MPLNPLVRLSSLSLEATNVANDADEDSCGVVEYFKRKGLKEKAVVGHWLLNSSIYVLLTPNFVVNSHMSPQATKITGRLIILDMLQA